ncbi:hypothetical protein DFH09DRAFT_1299599 [Mycena vulgaris]|nr:hypothetical protein DFH09DRAFT_1299599 [Mycena vulgaris]
MGRRAKYLTAEAQASANRSKAEKYAQTSHAKVVRACTRRAQYLHTTTQKGGSHPPRCIPGLPVLSARITELQGLPLPETEYLFREALASALRLDESGVQCWKEEPPFFCEDDTADPLSPDAQAHTHRIAIVVHGIKMREQTENGRAWCADFESRGWEVCMNELREEVAGLLTQWERLMNSPEIYHPYHDPREYIMEQHYLQWLART